MAGRRARRRAHPIRPIFDVLLPLLAGGLIAMSIPPWNIGSSALGLGLWLYLLRDTPRPVRVRRSAVATLAWFGPTTVWMLDLTAPGWPVVLVLWAALFGAAGAIVPDDHRARWAFPAVITLTELVRWHVPFGGVPIATIAMAEVGMPWDSVVRWFGSPFLVLVTAVLAVGVAEVIVVVRDRTWSDRRAWIPAGVAAGLCTFTVLTALAAPRAEVVDTIEVAVVQGGGPQNTRADVCENRRVFERHVTASSLIEGPVDLIVWPEDVVHPSTDGATTPPRCDQPLLGRSDATRALESIAIANDAVVVSGWFEPSLDRTANENYAVAMDADGTIIDRYDKVRLVPFGEFVPLRSLIEAFSDELPLRDVRAGTEPAVLQTPAGRLGVAISWEIFFDHRARDAIGNGGQVLLNPTNGSSYWLTIVQSQQIASTRLRALETDRWVLQAAPTGYSAVVTPDADVIGRTEISEAKVIQATIELREGTTTAVRWGAWPALLVSLAALVVARGRDTIRVAAAKIRSRRAG